MQVVITFTNLPKATVSLDDWISVGKMKGYCKANKIKLNQIIEIEYVPNGN